MIKSLIAIVASITMVATVASAQDVKANMGNYIFYPGGGTTEYLGIGHLIRRGQDIKARWTKTEYDTLGSFNLIDSNIPITNELTVLEPIFNNRSNPNWQPDITRFPTCVMIPSDGSYKVTAFAQWSLWDSRDDVFGYRQLLVTKNGAGIHKARIVAANLPLDVAAQQEATFIATLEGGDCLELTLNHTQNGSGGGWLNVVASLTVEKQ